MNVSEMDGLLSRLVNDPNSEVWSQTIRLEALNSAQRELVQILLGFSQKYQGIFDLLNEIQEVKSILIDSTGIDLGSQITERYFLRNGFVNCNFTDPDGNVRWCERIPTDKMGITENRYFAGTIRDPKCRLFSNKFYVDVSVGYYPLTANIFYVGMPFTLGTTASGTDRDRTVTTCELNPLFHDLIVLMAEVKLRRMRGDKNDFEQAAFVQQFVTQQIQLLVSGSMNEPQTKTTGQFARNQDEFMLKRSANTQGVANV